MPECTTDSQCQLVNDCCSCLGIAAGETAPACNVPECVVPRCTPLGVTGNTALCSAGQCVAGIDCDHSKVECDAVPPQCPPGETPGVKNGCWTSCVPATECATIADCAQCGAGQACVKNISKAGPMLHCVAKPPACSGAPDCACMGAATCVGAFNICNDEAPGVLACACPTC